MVALLLGRGSVLVRGVGGVKGLQFIGAAKFLEHLRGIKVRRNFFLLGFFHAHNRRVTFAMWQLNIATRRNSARVLQRLWNIRKQRRHFLRALHIQLLRILHAIRRVLVLGHAYAAQRVMRVMIFLAQKMRVIVAHHGQFQLLGQLLQQRINAPLILVMPLQFNVKTRLATLILSKVLGVPQRLGARVLPMFVILILREQAQVKCDA